MYLLVLQVMVISSLRSAWYFLCSLWTPRRSGSLQMTCFYTVWDPRRRSMTTSMVGLTNGHIHKNLTNNGEPQRSSWEVRRKRYTVWVVGHVECGDWTLFSSDWVLVFVCCVSCLYLPTVCDMMMTCVCTGWVGSRDEHGSGAAFSAGSGRGTAGRQDSGMAAGQPAALCCQGASTGHGMLS